MIIGAQLFICLDMSGLAAICTFSCGTSGFLNGLSWSRWRGPRKVGVNGRLTRSLRLFTGMSTLLVPL